MMYSNNITVSFDYNNQKINLNYINSTGFSANYSGEYHATVINSQGVYVCEPFSLSNINMFNRASSESLISTDSAYATMAYGSGSFGIYARGKGKKATSSAIFNCDLLHGENGIAGQEIFSTLYTPQAADILTEVPAIIERGDAVFNGKATGIFTKNLVYFTGRSYNVTQASSADLTNYIGLITSGNGSGTYFSVTNTGDANSFYADIDFVDYTGSLFKLMPRVTITGNTAWTRTNTCSQLYSNQTLYTGLGYTYLPTVAVTSYIALGDVSGYTAGNNAYIDYFTSYGGMVVDVSKDLLYQNDIQVGDLLVYRTYDNPTLFATGVIYGTGEGTSTLHRLLVYPSGDMSNIFETSDGYIYRHTVTKLMTYPKFDENHAAIVYIPYTGVYATATPPTKSQIVPDVAIVKTPSARLEVSANDYDSSYAGVGSRSHFFVGPVVLSNGEVLSHRELTFSGSLYNSDPTQSSPDKSWSMRATNDGSVSEKFTGQYYRLGTFVGTHSQQFTSAEMLSIDAQVTYGACKSKIVLNIPVHPNV